MSTSPSGTTIDPRRVAIVTGASSGIGRATAVRLAADGMIVILAARRADELGAVAAEITRRGGSAIALPMDVTRRDDIERLVSRVVADHGRIDALVNVAGIGHARSIMTDDGHVERVIATNLTAPIRLMRAVIPIMTKQRSGTIVNIGSVSGEIGFNGIYSATKFGIRGLTDSVRRELAGTGVRVSLIEPGYIATPLTAGRSGRMPGPEIVARSVANALRRPRRKIVVPVRYRLAMIFCAAFPGLVDLSYARRAAKRDRVFEMPDDGATASAAVRGTPASGPDTNGTAATTAPE
jgi:NAD(P)-dependent dehydrogenase (short-subunit alcohol dehydrogenase family)